MLADLSTLQNDGHGSGQRMSGGRHVIIVGGGASGVLLACHLLRRFSDNFKVTLIEKHSAIGRGLAYGTVDPAHLLNVRAANMSAFADDPDHFWQWLLANNLATADSEQFCFVSRRIYGRYIESLLRGLTYADNRELNIVRAECVAISSSSSGAVARLADGCCIEADIVVLATGNEACQTRLTDSLHASPWQALDDNAMPKDGHVVILGTGLTMVDCVQSLLHGGYQGQITAISRHGLLPRPHRLVAHVPINRADVPFGAGIAQLTAWIRGLIRSAEHHAGDWRSVIDGMRPFTQELWQSLSIAERRRFLRHARTFWDVHRHRMAPEVEDFIADAMASGQLKVRAGKAQSIERGDHVAHLTFRPRGSRVTETIRVDRVVNCTGVNPIPYDASNPVLRSLFDSGLARLDPLGVGLDTTDQCALVGKSGEPSARIFAVGPLTRATFWEIVAIPDIRVQCHRLTAHIGALLDAA
jgi:uncharacterized NAD(P)/FAD-binding protein YdhS